jgi:hypothetical protein
MPRQLGPRGARGDGGHHCTAAARKSKAEGDGGFYGDMFALTPAQGAHVAEARGLTVHKTIAQFKALDREAKGSANKLSKVADEWFIAEISRPDWEATVAFTSY